jgi:hypothetical protein
MHLTRQPVFSGTKREMLIHHDGVLPEIPGMQETLGWATGNRTGLLSVSAHRMYDLPLTPAIGTDVLPCLVDGIECGIFLIIYRHILSVEQYPVISYRAYFDA